LQVICIKYALHLKKLGEPQVPTPLKLINYALLRIVQNTHLQHRLKKNACNTLLQAHAPEPPRPGHPAPVAGGRREQRRMLQETLLPRSAPGVVPAPEVELVGQRRRDDEPAALSRCLRVVGGAPAGEPLREPPRGRRAERREVVVVHRLPRRSSLLDGAEDERDQPFHHYFSRPEILLLFKQHWQTAAHTARTKLFLG
jgi:hypothetical protein